MEKNIQEALQEERGAALLGVLLLLLILTLLAGSGFLVSLTEMSIASNHEASLQAAYAAEAGLQELLSRFRRRPDLFLERKPLADLGFPLFDSVTASCPGSSFCLEDLHYEPAAPPAFAEVVMVGQHQDKKGLSRVKGLIQGMALGGAFPVPYPFLLGLVAAGRLEIHDPLGIRGDLHGFRGYAIHPVTILESLKKERFSVTQSEDPLRSDYRWMPDIPRITEDRFQEYRAVASTPPHQRLSGPQSLTLSGDQGGKFLWVEGDLSLKAVNLSGMVVVVSGKLIVQGNTLPKPGGTLDTAFLSGQDMVLKPTGELSGVFWSNGSVSAAGPGKIRGALVSQGDLLIGTGLDFEREIRMSNAFLAPLSPTVTFRLVGWSQM